MTVSIGNRCVVALFRQIGLPKRRVGLLTRRLVTVPMPMPPRNQSDEFCTRNKGGQQ